MLQITVENLPQGRVRVALTGRLDTQTYAECEARLQPLLIPATRMLVFDMAGLDYISSMGLRVLMKTNRAMAAHGGKCVLTRLQPPIRKVIEIANALPREAVFASIEEADRYLDIMQQRAREEAAKPGQPPV
jgi:anti-sigma B factor antagonist